MAISSISGASTPVRAARRLLALSAFAAAAAVPGLSFGQAFNAGLPAGSTCLGNCGTLGADGDVPLSGLPGSTAYGYVSTSQGVDATSNGIGYGLGGETNGSQLSFAFNVANPGTLLSFAFNYITSDGTLSFIEYGFAELTNTATNESIVLFNARTRPYSEGATVPGFGMPPIQATVVGAPAYTVPGTTNWSPLGGSSGDCYQGLGNGCGATGWLSSFYNIAAAGSYELTLGVVNWGDTAFDTGMAFDFALGEGNVPVIPGIPEPSTYALFALGLAAVAAGSRRRSAAKSD